MQRRDIIISPSKLFIFIQLLLAVGSILVIFYLPIVLGLKAIFAGLSFMYSYMLFKHHGTNPLVKKITCLTNGIQIETKDKTLDVHIAKSSTLTQWVMILRFQCKNKPGLIPCVIFRDAITPDEFRYLLVNIRNNS